MSTVITQQKTDIRKSKPEAIQAFLAEIGEKPFRAKQIHEWLWKKSARSFEEMTNKPPSSLTLLPSAEWHTPLRT